MHRLAVWTAVSLYGGVVASVTQAGEPAIIPQPQKMEVRAGVFQLSRETRIYTDPASMETGEFLAGRLRESTGLSFRISGKTTPDCEKLVFDGILLTTNDADASLGDEGYALTVTTNHIIIRAPSQAALFYGVQTLLQLLPPQIFSSNVVSGVDWQMPGVEIRDWPQFRWRGLMLDVSRHFFTKGEVEQLLDAMALHKLNVFHWHLTDDQGWRIQIKKYPKLTSVGAWRDGVGFDLPTNSTTAYDKDGRYGGFYTQQDIREVVAYAAARHITVVPEIEMPGHSMAALAAYPEFGTGGGPFTIPLNGGVKAGVYDPANPATFQFLEDVLTEVFELFPCKYIHIGGDEVPPGPWEHDAGCQALMKREGLKTPAELESWFIQRIEKFVNAHGKTLIGWSEIAHGGLATNAVVMDWIGGGKEAAQTGHDVVMTPTSCCYLDFYQSKNYADEPHAMNWGGDATLRKVYSFEPIPNGLAPEFQNHILGAQGNLWTELVPNLKHAEYMIFPRLSALAEVTWSAKNVRDYGDFLDRVKVDEKRLSEMGVNYRDVSLGDGSSAGKRVGGWQPSQISTLPEPMEFDLTGKVKAAGQAVVSFEYTEGANGLDIAWVALFQDGKEISRDAHDGFTGNHPRNPSYTLAVPTPKAGVKYTLRAEINGDGGTNSHGNVYFAMKPSSPK